MQPASQPRRLSMSQMPKAEKLGGRQVKRRGGAGKPRAHRASRVLVSPPKLGIERLATAEHRTDNAESGERPSFDPRPDAEASMVRRGVDGSSPLKGSREIPAQAAGSARADLAGDYRVACLSPKALVPGRNSTTSRLCGLPWRLSPHSFAPDLNFQATHARPSERHAAGSWRSPWKTASTLFPSGSMTYAA